MGNLGKSLRSKLSVISSDVVKAKILRPQPSRPRPRPGPARPRPL